MIAATLDTPIGELLLLGDGRRRARDPLRGEPAPDGAEHDDAAFVEARGQLAEYFAGGRTELDFPLARRRAPRSSSASGRSCAGSRTARRSATRSSRGGSAGPRAVRAVGHANGRNPLPVVVPCHRVVGSDGTLTGYGGGLERKRALLELEAATSRRA